VTLALAVVISPLLIAVGATMPLLFNALPGRRCETGAQVGALFCVNAVGCLFGAVGGGYLLLEYFDLDLIYRLTLLMIALTILLCPLPSSASSMFLRNASRLAIVLALVIPLLLPNWTKFPLAFSVFRLQRALTYSHTGPVSFYQNFFAQSRLVAYRDDPNSTVAVVDLPADDNSRALYPTRRYRRNLMTNGRSEGETSLGDSTTTRLLAHLPMLLGAGRARDVAVVGFGLGVTAGSFSLYPGVDRIDCFELSSTVRQFARYFDFANYSIRSDPRLHWIIGDAFRELKKSGLKYAVIVSEPSNLWVHGVDRLYTREFYQASQNLLSPAGIFAQWVDGYSLSTESFFSVLTTFSTAFPYFRMFYAGPQDFILLGSLSPLESKSIDTMDQAYAENRLVRQALSEVGIDSGATLLGREIWLNKAGIAAFKDSSEEHSLLFPKLGYRAARDFFSARSVLLPELLKSSEFAESVSAAGRESLLARWRKKHCLVNQELAAACR